MSDSGSPLPTHLERGDYIADVLQGSSAYPFWYYTIHRKDTRKIIDLVKFDSYEQALSEVQRMLDKLNQVAKRLASR